MNSLRLLITIVFVISTLMASAEPLRHFPPGVKNVYIPDLPNTRASILQNIATVVNKSIDEGFYPGAVILAAHHGQIIYRGVFGNRRIVPDVAPMTFDTVFDLASLTKVLVTTTAIMQLVEKGKINLDMPIAHYWPAFCHNGKSKVTVRELMTHTSGFPAGLTFSALDKASGECTLNELANRNKTAAVHSVEQQPLINVPGTIFKYSDVNFVALGHLVEIVSGEKLDHYAQKHIFRPLRMQHTFYLPPARVKDEIAPTEVVNGKLRWGEVHDDTAHLMGGVSGMAGLFSNAKDLGIFAQCLVNQGRINSHSEHNKYLLSPLSVLKMSTPQTPTQMLDVHGLGWDIDSSYSIRGDLFPINSYGHTGWTGTSLLIDPVSHTWLIILTSRTHPTAAGINQLIQDRKTIANIVASSITDISWKKNLSNTGKGELQRAYR